jgi:subtilisin family serine protease
MKVALICAASLLAVLALSAVSPVVGDFSSEGGLVSFKLAHTSIFVRASSFSAAHGLYSNADHLQDAFDIAAASEASHEELQEHSDHIFHQTKFSAHGSRAATSTPTSFSLRSLGAKLEHKQFFVHFSVRSDVRTLAALHKFTGHRVIAHIEGGLYVAIGDDQFAVKARRFPGVSWVQEREGSSKLGNSLQQVLKETTSTVKDGRTEIIAECWYDGCGAAAVAVRAICPDVYVHPTLVEVHCPHHSLPAALSVLSAHVGVDHVDVKPVSQSLNFGGKAIIGAGPSAISPLQSLVLSNISTKNSVIAVADSGIDMNSCFFYDNSSSRPWNNSRLLHSYVVAPCEQCGRCCNAQSGAGCSNSSNACGNFIDQSGHGTHVAGTVAGSGPDAVAYGNGIATGAKIFFQDMENILDDRQCYAPGKCPSSIAFPTDLQNLFQPAFKAGARVHTNSWTVVGSTVYSSVSRAVDVFTSANPTFLVLFAAGNSGQTSDLGQVAAPGTCKNCLTVGASQQSDALFRSMQPFDDGGSFCSLRGQFPQISDPCCGNPLSCISKCCLWPSSVNTSLSCCADPPTCANSGGCSVPGGVRSATNVATFSSRGPTSDGRFKPDLVAPGEDILSAATPRQVDPNVFSSTSPNHCVVPSQGAERSPLGNFNNALSLKSGTSMATPLMAGAVEKIRQYFVQGYYPLGIPGSGAPFEPAEALVRAVVLASCQSVFSDPSWEVLLAPSSAPRWPPKSRTPLSPALNPHFFQGFGLPVLDHAVHMAGSTNGYRMHYTNGTFSPSSLAAAYNIPCDSAAAIPLTLALVWTDAPGNVNSQKQLVNDLDLIVLLPGSNPPQLFGNMASYADQINTVERVVIGQGCPASGFVTAIVAPGDSLKTSSQAWFLVANGPVKSEFSPVSLPTFFRGRSLGPVTQSQACTLDPVVSVSVNFKPSSAWPCITRPSETLDCSVRRQELAASLAQVVGVAVQGIRVTSTDANSVSMDLVCSAMINSWQSEASTLKYVTSTMSLAAIRNVSASTFDADRVLRAFDWSTIAVKTKIATISTNVTFFSDSNCKTMRSNPYLSAPNPLAFNDADCSPGPVVSGTPVFLRATSCRTSASFYVSVDPKTCVRFSSIPIMTYPIGICQQSDDGTDYVIVQCSAVPIIVQASIFSDTECSTPVGSSSISANPVLVTNDACMPLTFQGMTFYLRAASCGADVVVDYFRDATCQQTFLLFSDTRKNNSCERNGMPAGMSIKFVCRVGTAPPSPPSLPPADAASTAAGSATSPGVIAGSVIGAVFCKPYIRCATSPFYCWFVMASLCNPLALLLRSRRYFGCCRCATQSVRCAFLRIVCPNYLPRAFLN